MINFSHVQKELIKCGKDVEGSGIKLNIKGDSLAHLIGTIPGPIGTPFEGGIFKIDITIPAHMTVDTKADIVIIQMMVLMT
ncbi:hypothetical protein K1719_011812 [Acacia pycnantha]|nr:hypothetical protein K1719_011812 [Acacia pycnantha]